ncbi:alpha/beta hydrolase [Paraburkholderia sp. MMS20-SJTR3]|uniref:Alpha/beta hydrolase n=1 Tax=Paraburkholderia sejongensis TaxID=2886946 RepID=A0ABS8JZ91_9BURK|nr:alpha/beta hydrolase [Paraburkholderia sp. MMS20-SJTR3]MCC8395228.1 alpha/beta hydrolase [Paraburkholderia sp. MMS20-SJTR3]
MFRRRCAALSCALSLLFAPFSALPSAAQPAADAPAGWHVGAASRVFHPAAARDWRGAQTEALITRIWYPADPSQPETRQDIGPPGRPIFVGHPVAASAPLSSAHPRYPLVLLSHGTGGSAESLDWLAGALAARGFIVAGVEHLGNNALEPLTRDGFTLWWERATDLSEVLDGMLADPQFGPRVDPARIGALGFSLGGYTVLELAGARTDLAAFERFCTSPAADAICMPPEAARLVHDTGASSLAPTALSPATRASRARAGDSYRDPRIKAVFAIAPALGEAFDPDGFAAVTIPVALLAGSADQTAPVDTNIRRIASLVPRAPVTLVPGASHYTFMDVCEPAAVERLPMLCKDGPGVARAAVHAQTAAQVGDFFAATLAPGAS